MLRFHNVRYGVFVAVLSACVQQSWAEEVALPAAAANANQTVKPALVQALQDALKTEKDLHIRLFLAKALVRIAPEDGAAANELVKALTEGEQIAEAVVMIEELIPSAPPALVKALLPVLKDGREINRRRAAVLLGHVDPRALR